MTSITPQSLLSRLLFIGIWILVVLPTVHARQNIDSLISSWNRLSAEYLKVNQIDSACKYGNCVVDLMEKDLEKESANYNAAEFRNLLNKKAEALGNLVTAYGNSDRIDLAMECYEEALAIYEKIDDQESIFRMHMRMARVNDLRSCYMDAIPLYKRACKQALKNNDLEGMATTYYHLGLNNRYLGNYSEALVYHFEDLSIQEELDDKKGIANAHVTIAAILKKLNDPEAALDKLHLAQYLYNEINDTIGIAMVMNDLATTYEMLGDTSNALDHHLEAAKLREWIDEYNGLGASYSYIARIYLSKGEHSTAFSYLKKANSVFHKGSNPQGSMTSLIDMARVYFDKKDMDSSIFWLGYAENTALEIMNYYGLIQIYSIKGEVYIFRNQYDKAIAIFRQALSFAEEQNYQLQIYKLNSHLAEIFEKLLDYKEAYVYQSKSLQYKDSINLNANSSAAIQMEMEYNYGKEKIKNELLQEKKDLLNEAALAKQETQKWFFFAGVMMFLIISLGLFSRLRYIRGASKALLEQKEEAERQKKRAEKEKEKATQSEMVKQKFLANMSHEIRTPMNAIKGMTDIIIKNEHPSSQDKFLNAIKQSSENLLIILNEILDLSKLEAGKFEFEKIQFAPQKVLHNIKNILRYKAEEKGLSLTYTISNNVPMLLCGDPTRLNQVLVNLGSNAIKFTEKGSVTIEAEAIHRDEHSATLQFKVVDTGIGIPKEKMGVIFEAFKQADANTTRKYGGTGLGLSISKQLVELQNGSISVESNKLQGSTFTIEIPYELSTTPVNEQADEIIITRKDLKILLVEDNEFNILVAQHELESSIPGVKIDVAENGKIAIDRVHSNDYNLILMDIQMPEMDGYDATKMIRQMKTPKANIPIMAMTANVLKAEVDRCFAAGMNAFISKPFDKNELLQNINKLLDIHTLSTE